ncbi:hypothetical protein HZH68_008816 [Vespula germanica]|uniref:Uncharacterized protein n=1 Tax=Vespula germanica TaxID=30212 RepID=A0A834N7D4_VESGE|nr:hypothetical protein HZH68_008816 [Vespula germanica]
MSKKKRREKEVEEEEEEEEEEEMEEEKVEERDGGGTFLCAINEADERSKAEANRSDSISRSSSKKGSASERI